MHLFRFVLKCFLAVRKQMSPDVTSYGAVVSSCEKDAEWQLALHLLRRWQHSESEDKKIEEEHLNSC